MAPFEITPDDPRREDVMALLERHLAHARTHTPPAHVFALDLEGLLDPAIFFFSLRDEGRLLGIGALKRLDADHAEVKSMHTASEARRQGVGRAILDRLVTEAAARGYRRVSLETGSMEAFAPARSLYAQAGFVECGPFGDYDDAPTSTFMTLWLGGCGREDSNLQEPKLNGT